MLLWLAKGALGDAFTIAWSLDFFRRQSGIQKAVVLGSPAVEKVVRELDFVQEVHLLPDKSDLPGWWRLKRHFSKLPIQILGLQGKGQHQALLAKSLKAPITLDWQTLQARSLQHTIPLADILQNPQEGFKKLGFSTHPLVQTSPLLPFKNLPPSNHRQGVVFAPLTSPSWPSKAWPMSHALTLGKNLKDAGVPLSIVGAANERDPLLPFQDLGLPLLTGLNIHQLGTLLSQSKLSLSGDSMMAHAAPLYGTKALIFLGPTTERYISRHPGLPQPIVLKKESLACLGCHKPTCPLEGDAHSLCLRDLSPQRVQEVILRELGS